MKASLQLKVGQHLTMTPQLQQAIRLLQLSTLDLQQEIQEALDSNPLLEMEEKSNFDNENSSQDPKEVSQQVEFAEHDKNDLDSSNYENAESFNNSESFNNDDLKDDYLADNTWDDQYSASSIYSSSGSFDSASDIPYQGETTESLQDNLRWQWNLSQYSDMDNVIAHLIIDDIDNHGYLKQSCEGIQKIINKRYNLVDLIEVETVLKRIQHFEPTGVGARDVQECLLIQLNNLDNNTPYLNDAKLIIKDHIDLLASKDFKTLSRKTKLKYDILCEVVKLIHSLNPRPGSIFNNKSTQYIVPDVSVKKKDDKWVVELNPDIVPKLKVNDYYASFIDKNSKDSLYIKNNLQEAKWLIKSLESRNDTLMKVSNCIVEQQQDFFEYGEEAMKPMVLNDIAVAVDMHESTISRVTTQKYMHTPRGIFELKYFFSSHVATSRGGECSSTAIRAIIKKLIASENPTKPLSDSKISEEMENQGIKVARRTIAKYRESLSIPSSNQRKTLY